MGNAKYHHLIPQTYLRSWCYSGESVYSMNKSNLSEVTIKNISNNFGQNHYHSIRAGMPCCTNEDLLKIFEPLNNFKIFLDEKELSSLVEYNNNYFRFDEWELYYPNNRRVSRAAKNTIRSRIEANKILDIEELWSIKYESGWNFLLQMIQQRIDDATGTNMDEFYKGKLMKFIVSLNWRSFTSNQQLGETFEFINSLIDLRSIEIPKEDRNIATDETAYDEMKHNFLLKQFADFLSDKGIVYETAKGYIRHLGIRFLVSNGGLEFITSDNPSFTYLTDDGMHHIMPVNPRILISIGKISVNKDKYYIEYLSDNEVRKMNSLIAENSEEFIISHTATVEVN
jgi:hypothetical protein